MDNFHETGAKLKGQIRKYINARVRASYRVCSIYLRFSLHIT